MKTRFPWEFVALLLAVLVAAGLGLAVQRERAVLLRTKLALLQAEARELASLRAENARLRERQIPAAELEALRADHVAVARLRAELDALRKVAPAPVR
jgi:Tfp pilus assembly protein PilN